MYEICFRFSTTVAFEALWFRNGATCRKSGSVGSEISPISLLSSGSPIITTVVMVLSLRQSHCESSASSFIWWMWNVSKRLRCRPWTILHVPTWAVKCEVCFYRLHISPFVYHRRSGVVYVYRLVGVSVVRYKFRDFGISVYLQYGHVEFACEGHRVKDKVTWAKKREMWFSDARA